MRRLSTFIFIIMIVVGAFMLYSVKYRVQDLRAQVVDTERELKAEKEMLHVVAAEWAYLNRPERLQSLANKYITSSRVTVDQVAEIEAIPFPTHMEASAVPEEGIRPAPVRFQQSAGGAR